MDLHPFLLPVLKSSKTHSPLIPASVTGQYCIIYPSSLQKVQRICMQSFPALYSNNKYVLSIRTKRASLQSNDFFNQELSSKQTLLRQNDSPRFTKRPSLNFSRDKVHSTSQSQGVCQSQNIAVVSVGRNLTLADDIQITSSW